MIVKLLTEHHLEFLSLKGGCRGLSESTHVKMTHCCKSYATAHMSANENVVLIIWVLTQENLSLGCWEQQRGRPASASAQSHQRLSYSLTGKYRILISFERNFTFLASLCS